MELPARYILSSEVRPRGGIPLDSCMHTGCKTVGTTRFKNLQETSRMAREGLKDTEVLVSSVAKLANNESLRASYISSARTVREAFNHGIEMQVWLFRSATRRGR